MKETFSVTCPITGRDASYAELIEVGEYKVVHIKNSSLWTVLNPPGGRLLEKTYQSFDAGLLSRQNFDEYVSQAKTILLRDLGRAGLEHRRFSELRLFDYGCGGGHFVAAAESLGMNAMGMELDVDAAMTARKKGLNVLCGTLPKDSAEIERYSFHVIKLMHVLEHVVNPRALIASLFSVLAPGGFMIISVPDQEALPSRLKIMLRSLGIKKNEYGFVQPPIHLHGFTKRSFNVLAVESALELVYIGQSSPLDKASFPSTQEYWQGLKMQKFVYMIGRLIGSGGHITAILHRPES